MKKFVKSWYLYNELLGELSLVGEDFEGMVGVKDGVVVEGFRG